MAYSLSWPIFSPALQIWALVLIRFNKLVEKTLKALLVAHKKRPKC